jgi:hypothetical protein
MFKRPSDKVHRVRENYHQSVSELRVALSRNSGQDLLSRDNAYKHVVDEQIATTTKTVMMIHY